MTHTIQSFIALLIGIGIGLVLFILEVIKNKGDTKKAAEGYTNCIDKVKQTITTRFQNVQKACKTLHRKIKDLKHGDFFARIMYLLLVLGTITVGLILTIGTMVFLWQNGLIPIPKKIL